MESSCFSRCTLNAQHTDGGWTYDSASSKDSASSVDVTGMVLSALALSRSTRCEASCRKSCCLFI